MRTLSFYHFVVFISSFEVDFVLKSRIDAFIARSFVPI